jgi:antitoxin component YwqK of YwqJK toxin-antitoxin module
MSAIGKVLLRYLLPCVVVASAAAGYEYFIGFPRMLDGHRVHRETQWEQDNILERDVVYYAYTAPNGAEIKHGPFQSFDHGALVHRIYYRDGRQDGTETFWTVLGAKTNEVYYRNGQPLGWATYAQGTVSGMRLQIFQDGRPVALKTFSDNHFALSFNCGELINEKINPSSGEISPIANATERACAKP